MRSVCVCTYMYIKCLVSMVFDIYVLRITALYLLSLLCQMSSQVTADASILYLHSVSRALLSVTKTVIYILATPSTSWRRLGKLRTFLSLSSLICKRRQVIALPNGGGVNHQWVNGIKRVARAPSGHGSITEHQSMNQEVEV